MKVLPFKISKPANTALVYQEDHEVSFYNKYHQHEEIQLSLIVKGEGTLIIGDSVNKYKAGDILVIGSNLPHVFKSDDANGVKSLMISLFMNKNAFGVDFFELEGLRSLTSFFNKSAYGMQLTSNKIKLKELFLELKSADKLQRYILLFEIIRLINTSKTQQLSSFVYHKNYTDNEGKRISAVFDYTMSHFNNPISLSEIAEIATMTTNAFCKYFKQRTNKTYLQFLTEIRIEHACKLLSKSQDVSVSEIAIQSGFNTISNFNRVFKSLKKTTPLQYKLALLK